MRCAFGFFMSVLGIFLTVQLANADVRRWDKDQQKVERQAVTSIDIGDQNGGEKFGKAVERVRIRRTRQGFDSYYYNLLEIKRLPLFGE